MTMTMILMASEIEWMDDASFTCVPKCENVLPHGLVVLAKNFHSIGGSTMRWRETLNR